MVKNFNINNTDRLGNTALMYASRNSRNAESVKYLIELGSNVNQQNKDGWTALMYAADNNRVVEVLQVLLNYNANVLLKNKNGETPISRAQKNAFIKSSAKDSVSNKALEIIDLLKLYSEKQTKK